eukprot:1180728-Prorocentrum_minimum.AAC.6
MLGATPQQAALAHLASAAGIPVGMYNNPAPRAFLTSSPSRYVTVFHVSLLHFFTKYCDCKPSQPGSSSSHVSARCGSKEAFVFSLHTGTLAPQAMTQQATRHARRVYVGGLPPLANEAGNCWCSHNLSARLALPVYTYLSGWGPQTVAKFFSQALAAVGGTTHVSAGSHASLLKAVQRSHPNPPNPLHIPRGHIAPSAKFYV